MSTGVKSDTSKRLGALLLRGWAMLAENCPKCQVPLMKERTSDERLCVNCDTAFLPDGQGLRPINRPSQDPSELEPKQQHEQEQQQQDQDQDQDQDGSGLADRTEEGPYEYDPRADPRLGPFASSNPETQEALNTTLAQDRGPRNSQEEIVVHTGSKDGLESALPSIPAYPARKLAAMTEELKEESGTVSMSPLAANGPKLQRNADASTSSLALVTRSRESTSAMDAPEDVADLLAAKMLQGWALLDKYCPRCNTVLVRSKANKRMFCVACDAWVVTEADAPLQSQPQQPQKGERGQRDQIQEAGQDYQQRQVRPPRAASVAVVKTEAESVVGQQQASLALPLKQEPQHEPRRAPLLPQQQQYQKAAPLQSEAGYPRTPLGAVDVAATFVPEPRQLPPGSLTASGASSFSSDLMQQQQQQQKQKQQMQLPPMYQQSFAPAATGSGSASCSRGSSPPQHWLGASSFNHEALLNALGAPGQQYQQPRQGLKSPRSASSSGQGLPQVHGTGISAAGTSGGGGGGGGSGGGNSSKQPIGTALLLTIGRTVALKMAEAQGLLERTPALDTERARTYVALISECLDLLSKLHSLQQ